MNWINALYDLYDKNESLAGTFQETGRGKKTKTVVLLPLYHSTVKAQIEVAIDILGNFRRARVLDKAEALTLIPVTELSAGRTSDPSAPHALMDNLTYLAGDYDTAVAAEPNKKGAIPEFRFRFDDFMGQLGKWCDSGYAHPKATAIYRYLQKERLASDLIEFGVLQPDDNGEISYKQKIQNIAQTDAFIRFRVETPGAVPDLLDTDKRYAPETWIDKTLQKSHIDYITNKTGDEGKALCYLTGQYAERTVKHPKKIRNEADGTKLFSSNDNDGFTYRGRFTTDTEAFAIGSEASQKIHNALKWIIRKQGYTQDGLCVVTWESDLKPYVPFHQNPVDIILESFVEDDDTFTDDEPTTILDTNFLTAKKFNMALRGYKAKLSSTSNMIVLALDAATQGRLAMTYFSSLDTSSYLDNIIHWHEACCWRHETYNDMGRRFVFEGMASLQDIAKALYGTEQNKQLALKTNSDGRTPMLASVFQRLTPCITERKRVPSDMVRLATTRASAPLSFEDYNWEKILAVSCSFVRKEKIERTGEDWTMSLDKNCKNRSYLYGRLLAAADCLEESTFERGEKRATNAIRYMNAFSQRPYRTWKIIAERLTPYLNKQSKGTQVFYQKLFSEIHNLFLCEQFADDSGLEGLYLLGFYNQRSELRRAKDKDSENNNNDIMDGGEDNE